MYQNKLERAMLSKVRCWLVLWACLSVGISQAQMTPEQAKALGASVATGAFNGALSPSALAAKGSTPGPDHVMGDQYTGETNPDQTSKVREPSMIGIGTAAKANAVAGFKGYNNDRATQAEQATYFLSTNTRPRVQLSSSDPIFRVGNAMGNEALLASGTAVGCELPVYRSTYDSEKIYTCSESVSTYVSSCRKQAAVECVAQPADAGCDAGGIVTTSWAGDMSTSYTPDGTGSYTLQFGTVGNNYWGGGVYDRTLVFQVTNMDVITKFILTRAAFDDYILVSVNDNVVYVGPYGGDRLEATDWGVRYSEAGYGSWELSTEWNQYPNVDVKKHLKLGENKIFVRTMVGGKGESAVLFSTRQKCPAICQMKWSDYCGAHEGMVK